MKQQNTIMKRGFMEWAILAVAVLGTIALINHPLSFSSVILAFLIGICFCAWMMGRFIIRYQEFIAKYQEICKEYYKAVQKLQKMLEEKNYFLKSKLKSNEKNKRMRPSI